MDAVHILGGGPAGCAAALSAMASGAAVRVIEKSIFPKHKVCGEFLSPEVEAVLAKLGVWDCFAAAAPARIREIKLQLGRRSIRSRLPDPGFGLSRFAFDTLLANQAIAHGAEWTRATGGECTVVATGRSGGARKGHRTFGFKAHFEGPADDAVELYFFRGCYVGLNLVEGGLTNVCGLGPERELQRYGFDIDVLLESCEALRERVRPLRRVMKWLHVGPLVYGNRLQQPERVYRCGDALSFVDPFTGSGLVNALITGDLAGTCAARSVSVAEYLRACRATLSKPFAVAKMLRSAAQQPWAGPLASMIPAELLFRWTRPRISA